MVQLPQETYATDIHWVPSGGKKRELFVLACTDGRFLFISRLGRVEKSVEAHKGAVLGAQWSYDTTALLTCELVHYTDQPIRPCLLQCGSFFGDHVSSKGALS